MKLLFPVEEDLEVFQCNDAAGTNVTYKQVCNFQVDCPETGLDEASCGEY